MELVSHLLEVFLHVVGEKVLDLLEDELDYPSFQQELERELNELGKNICREVLEGADAWLKQNPRERKGWVVERRDESKSVLTPFGLMSFQRTYYRNKRIGGYAHLADRLAGLTPHAKTDLYVKAKLVDSAAEISYRKAGNKRGLPCPLKTV
mgnify:FL=1